MRVRPKGVAAPLALVFALALAAPVEGQVGIGIGVRSSLISDVQNLLTPTVYVPIVVTDRLVVEPEMGLLRSTEEEDGEDATVTLLTLGAGLLFEIGDLGEDRIYVGPRVGIVRSSFSQDVGGGEFSDSTTNLFLAGVVGGEFFAQENFSLGGEAGLRYVGTGSDDDEGSMLSTTAEFRVRWYFP